MLDTRATLLFRIRDPQDGLAWGEFVRLYAPLLHGYAMKNGLQDADAADLAQETLRQVVRAAPAFAYDPTRGSFRGWLLTIARNQLRNFHSRNAGPRGAGDSEVHAFLENQPAPDDAAWEREYQLHLFHWAAQRVKVEFRDSSWQAFWQTVVEQHPPAQVASALGMTLGAVYVARSRITARIRQEVQKVEGDEA